MQVQPTKLLIIGATRGVGHQLVQQALEAGHEVSVLVRDPARLQVRHPRLHVHTGDATRLEDVRRAVRDQDGVLSALGAPATSREAVRERGARALAEAMATEGVRRLVMLSSHGVGETFAELPWFMRWLVVPLYLKRAFADHHGQEEVIRDTDLDWTLVRPPHLRDGPGTGAYVHGFGAAVVERMKIARADVAAFMLAQLGDDTYLRQAPAVCAAA